MVKFQGLWYTVPWGAYGPSYLFIPSYCMSSNYMGVCLISRLYLDQQINTN